MAKRGGFPGGMPGNMNNLMKQAQRMQRQMEEATKELESKEYTATSGGGAVSVTVSGKKEVVSVKLSEEVVDPEYYISEAQMPDNQHGAAACMMAVSEQLRRKGNQPCSN